MSNRLLHFRIERSEQEARQHERALENARVENMLLTIYMDQEGGGGGGHSHAGVDNDFAWTYANQQPGNYYRK